MKLTLLVEEGRSSRRQYVLERGGLEIGRAMECDVLFDGSQANVSRHHASLTRGPLGYVLADHSSNGTWVNGQRIQKAVLESGDVIRLGADGPRLRVSVSTDASRASEMSRRGARSPTRASTTP